MAEPPEQDADAAAAAVHEAAKAAGIPGIGSLASAGLGTIQTAVGFALGVAASGALEPVGTGIRQAAFTVDPNRAIDAKEAARIVAEGIQPLDWGQGEAANDGIDGDRFEAMVNAEYEVPAVGELVTLLRRGMLSADDLEHALEKLQLEPRWRDLVKQLQPEPLEPGELAKAIHRGIIAGDGLLVSEPSTTPGKVPIVPPSNIDPVEQAAWSGLTKEKLRVLVGNAGLPPGIMEGLTLLNRGAITEDDFSRLVGESNMRNEWADVMLTLRRQLPTARDYLENALRGYRTLPEALAGAALHGMTREDATMIYQNQGRPMALHQITTALARGGEFKPEPGEITDPYRASIVEGSLKPAYYDLAFANRYSYPSPFVIRSLAQTGALSHDDTLQTLLEIGWKPEFARKVTKAWSDGSAAAVDSHVGKAQTQLWTAAHKAYLNGLADDTEATADLTAAGVDPAAIPAVLTLWAQEREITRRSLTPTQIKKAIGQPGLDAAWAKARLLKLGYSPADADAFLLEK